MTDQLPIPSIELLLLQLFLASVTFLSLALILAWQLKRKNIFRWKPYILMLLMTLILGNVCAIFIWGRWPFSFDIMLGPIYLPGVIAYGGLMGIGFYIQSYLDSKLEK